MYKVTEKFPNITSDSEVFMCFDYRCVEHYPYPNSLYIGTDFAKLCDLCDVHLPADCTYAHYRRKGYNTIVKEFGRYSYIINSKICFPEDEKNA